MGDDRPSRYIEVDAEGAETVVYRASGVGGCIRAMVAAARGEQPRPHQQWFQDVLDEGTRMEGEILRQFADRADVEIIDTQPEVELEIGVIGGRRVIVRGHMDGIGAELGVVGTRWVVEAKKFRASTYPTFLQKKVEVNAYYPWQLSVYMHATGLPAKFVGGEYVPEIHPDAEGRGCPESIARVEWFTYLDAPISLATIKQRVAKVERLVNEGYGADEVECSGSYPCGFWYLHDQKAADVEVELDTTGARMIVAEWQQVAGQIKELSGSVKVLEARKKQLAEELRLTIAAAGQTAASKFRVGDYAVAWTRTTVPEKTTKGYEMDYFTVKKSPTTRENGAV